MAAQEIVRQILAEIERDPAVSQRRLADQTGISVGMINWHIRRCVSKGLIKLQQAPLRRYLYYLTPAGFVEKADLTARFLQSSFSIFKIGREEYEKLFVRCAASGWNNVVLIGQTELTELALMVASRVPSIRILGIIDRNPDRLGREIVASSVLAASGQELLQTVGKQSADAVLVCHYLSDELERNAHPIIIDELRLDQTRLLIPEFLL